MPKHEIIFLSLFSVSLRLQFLILPTNQLSEHFYMLQSGMQIIHINLNCLASLAKLGTTDQTRVMSFDKS